MSKLPLNVSNNSPLLDGNMSKLNLLIYGIAKGEHHV